MTSSPRSFVCSIDVVVVGHFPHSLLPWLFLLRFIKCPLNGPIVRPINPFLSTERTSLRSPALHSQTSESASARPRPSSRTRFATTLLSQCHTDRRRTRRRRMQCCRKTVSSRETLYCAVSYLLHFRSPYGNRHRHTTTCTFVPRCLIKRSGSFAPSSKTYAGVKCHSSHA